jgi:GT2 family glycosyltransferase
VGIAVPRLLEETGELSRSLRREPSVTRTLAEAVLGGRIATQLGLSEVIGGRARYAEGHERAAWATGAAMLVSPACRRAVGAWDESFFLYSEETDFALRARDAGWRLRYVPESTITHIGGESRVSPRLWSLLVVNKVRFYRRRHGRLRSVAFSAATLVGESLRAASGSPTHRAAVRALIAERTSGDALVDRIRGAR